MGRRRFRVRDAVDFFKGMLRPRMPGIRIPDAAIHDFTSDAMRKPQQ